MSDYVATPCVQTPLMPRVLRATTRVQFYLDWPGTSFCWCWEDVNIELVYNENSSRWEGTQTLCNGKSVTLEYFYTFDTAYTCTWWLVVTTDACGLPYSAWAVRLGGGASCAEFFTGLTGDCCATPSYDFGVRIFIYDPAAPCAIPSPMDPLEWCEILPDCCGESPVDSSGAHLPTPNDSRGNTGRVSAGPVRYASGELVLVASDVSAGGFGFPWGHVRSFSNRPSKDFNLGNGYNWRVTQWPYLSFQPNGSIVVVGTANQDRWYDKVGECDYRPRYSFRESLVKTDSGYQLAWLDGGITEFSEAGHFLRHTAAGGTTVEVTGHAANGFSITELERTAVVDGSTIVEQLLYEYDEPAAAGALLERVTLRRKVDAGEWENVSRAEYTYFGENDARGWIGDLESVRTAIWADGAWSSTGTTCYRYHTPVASKGSSSSSSSGEPGELPAGELHLLKYVINPASYARMVADGLDPLTAGEGQVAQYADFWFAYDADRRVTMESIEGGSRTFGLAYEESEFSDGPNRWKYKTTEMLPDGSRHVVYSNHAGQTMLKVFQAPAGGGEWAEFIRYDGGYLTMLAANPSAVTGYDEGYADLLHEVSGEYEHLKDNDGLIHAIVRDQDTGWLVQAAVKQGQLGTAVKVREYEYGRHYPASPPGGGGGAESSSSSSGAAGCMGELPPVSFVLKEIVYPSESDQQRTIETAYGCTFYEYTRQLKEKVTTLPAVPTEQNGSGAADTRRECFDEYGRLTWQTDERGFISRTKYDVRTGAVVQQIADVDTSIETDAPAGWETPSGGGLNLVTDFEHDEIGRVTQVLGPEHTIDVEGTATLVRRATWTVYQEGPTHDELWTAQGYASGTAPAYDYTLINPVSIAKLDKAGKVREQIAAVRESTAGKLQASDSFPQSSYVRWTTHHYTDCCHLAGTRVYHTIPESGEGAEGTHYDETRFGYDVMKRRNRQLSPGGTITFTVFEPRGLPVAVYVGTDDSGATESDPTGGGAPGNNMVLVTENEYDFGVDGGDGNLTLVTQHIDASTTRLTEFDHDWRNRRTETDGEVDFYQREFYDNLDRVVRVQRYDTLPSGNLIALSETKYDDRGRVFQTVRYGVDPATGDIGNALVDNFWFDAAGNRIKALPAGSSLFTKTVYDSFGRSIAQYVGYDLDESTYAEAGTLAGDTILEQSETVWDDGGNAIQTISRQRYHNAAASQTGALADPSTTPKARATYAAVWHDPIGRVQATADYGTNGGSALVRPSTIPAPADDVLVSTTQYNSAGAVESASDPKGMVTSIEYDDAARRVRVIENYQEFSGSSSSSASGGCEASSDTNRETRFTYTPDGALATLTAVNADTGDQVTTYTFGTTLSDSGIATSTLLRTVAYPDSSGSSDVVEYTYNRQAETVTVTDQRGCEHTFERDALGRAIHDRVTVLGTGVDGAVRRLSIDYEVRGLPRTLTSYDDADVGQGTAVNQVQLTYNEFGQPVEDEQSHDGAVGVFTPKVQYAYADGSGNTIRGTSLTYPNGRTVTIGYGAPGEMDDAVSRVAALIDSDVAETHLADYAWLGLRSPVIVDYTEPELMFTLVGTQGGDDPETGDIYRGLDRFGRVKDALWRNYGSSVDAARIQYGYDRASNRIWRHDPVAAANNAAFDELYAYDGLHRLKDMQRGTLNGSKTAITGATFAQCWTLDETGNWRGFREDEDGNGTWDLIQSRTANAVNEITEISETAGPTWADPEYDAAGNMTTIAQPADPSTAYLATYDAWNRLMKLQEDDGNSGLHTVAEYEYDARGYRVVTRSYVDGSLDATRHLYYSMSWQVLEERVGPSPETADPESQVVWGVRYIDDLVLRDRETEAEGLLDERLYALQDANWNVIALTDDSGAVLQRHAYRASGRTSAHDPQYGLQSTLSHDCVFLFAGYRLDARSALYHVRYRQLHFGLGTWLQRDPYVEPDSVNLHEYSVSNPLSHTDPYGLTVGVRHTTDAELDPHFYTDVLEAFQRIIGDCAELRWVYVEHGTRPYRPLEKFGMFWSRHFKRLAWRFGRRSYIGDGPPAVLQIKAARLEYRNEKAKCVCMNCWQLLKAAMDRKDTHIEILRTPFQDANFKGEVEGPLREVWVNEDPKVKLPEITARGTVEMTYVRFDVLLWHEAIGHSHTGLRHPSQVAEAAGVRDRVIPVENLGRACLRMQGIKVRDRSPRFWH